jgi:hypothetical protein
MNSGEPDPVNASSPDAMVGRVNLVADEESLPVAKGPPRTPAAILIIIAALIVTLAIMVGALVLILQNAFRPLSG